LTSFIGREKEIAEVKKLIAANRLTTLTGSGGTGKTRLSLQVAADLLDSFPDGVWFVELAPLVDPALVPQTVMTTIGLREEGNRPVLTILTDYLRPKTALLIFDNCEHLVEASAQLAEALLQACPSLRLLVSSREALGIPGETSYRVPSLSIPDTHLVQSVETVVQSEAARLFIERAQAISSGFAVTDANAAAVAQICARLDGIPLAIELAAARVKMLKAEQIAERLDDRFRLLTGGSRTALPRQQTLRAMIDWSYGLLPESERALLRRLSAFAGGWTLEAAETVCQGQGIDSYDVLDLLTQLVNKSLVVVDADDDTETRYRLLETVRQYAREKLSETGEGMAVRDLHLQYFLGLAEHAEPELVGPNAPEWQKRVEDDLDNIRAALEWSLKGDAQAGLRLANALGFFRGKGFHLYTIRIERANWLTQLLGRPATQPRNAARAKALLVLSAYEQAPANSQAYAEQSLSIYQELNDKAGIASVLLTLGGIIDAQENKVAALSFTFASLALYRKLGDKLGIARALGRLGRLLHTNDYTRAYAYVEESLGLYRELGFAAAVAESLTDLGGIARVSKDYGRARALLLEAQQINFSLGISVLNGGVAEDLGRLAFEEGHYEEARGYLEERIAFDREHGFENNQVTIISLGYVALRQGDQVYARSLFLETLLDARYYQYKTILNVWALEGLASLAVLQNELERAARLFSWTDMMRDTLGNKRTLAEQDEIDRDLAAIHAHLDEAAFAAARAAGRAMSMDQAVACALEAGSD
jgi:non-specific serine/threonine protein kinase